MLFLLIGGVAWFFLGAMGAGIVVGLLVLIILVS